MIDFNMFDLSDPKLSKSADALESALAQRMWSFPSLLSLSLLSCHETPFIIVLTRFFLYFST